MPTLDDSTWALIRACYENTTETVTGIALRHGINRRTISERATREDWRQRPSKIVIVRNRSDSAAKRVTTGPAPILSRPPDAPDVRIQRLYRVIDLQLQSLENDMSSGDPVTAQDHERRARAMHLIIESLDQAKEAASELLKREQHDASETFADAERSRRELAERVEKLGTRWDADGTS